MSVFNIKTGIFILVLAVAGVGIKMSGLVDGVRYQIDYFFNKDNLTDISGNKFILRTKKQVLVFINIDCTDFASEKNKILFVHNWREFFEGLSDYRAVVVVKLLNETESGRSEFMNYISMLNNSLTAYKKPVINVCIEEDNAFRNRYNIPQSQCVVILDNEVKATETFGSFYFGLSSTRLMSIIESNIEPYFEKMMAKVSEDPSIMIYNPKKDDALEADDV